MTIVKGEELGEVKRESINELFWTAIDKYPEVVAVRYRSGNGFTGMSYRQFGERVEALAMGLMALGLQKGDKVSLLADTRWEWVLADIAVLTAGGVTVTVYPTLSARTVQFIVDNSDSRMIIVENTEQLEKLLSIKDKLPQLEEVIIIESAGSQPEEVRSINEIMKLGRSYSEANPTAYRERWRVITPDDLSSIVYTSGTTGLPKGTMLSHWNWRFNVYAVTRLVNFEPGDTMLAFLPLAHVYMRLVYFAAVGSAATTYFSNPDNLANDLPLLRPKCFVSVPRLFERVYHKLMDQVRCGPVLQRVIFSWAAKVAREVGWVHSLWQKPGLWLTLKHRLADRLVFSKIRETIGVDNLKWTCSSGSSLSKDLAFFFNGLGITIIEGYGMTEVAAPSNLNPLGRFKPGTVGPPLAGMTQKIAPDGEILIKGDNVMLGYYKLPEETKEAFTEDGWLRTGDIGEFDKDGYLIFKERKKHIIVLSTGRNVAPLPIEEELKKSNWVEEAIVIGNDKRFTAALLQPAYQPLLELARKHKLVYDESSTEYVDLPTGERVPVQVDEKLLHNEAVLEIFRSVIDQTNEVFDHHEQVKQFRLLGEALSLEKGELTPTLKVKKKVILKKYNNLIEEIYAS